MALLHVAARASAARPRAPRASGPARAAAAAAALRARAAPPPRAARDPGTPLPVVVDARGLRRCRSSASAKPSSSSSPRRAPPARARPRSSGSRSVICEPMWHCTPTSSTPEQRARAAQDLERLADVHAELVLAQAGRDVGMRARVDVRVDAQRDARRAAARARRPRRCRAISSSLSALNSPIPCSSPSAISASLLPTPENTIRSGAKPARSAAEQLAARHDVGAGAEAREQPQQRAVAVGLERVADAVRHAREGRGRRPGTRPRAPRDCRRRAACRARPPPRSSGTPSHASSASARVKPVTRGPAASAGALAPSSAQQPRHDPDSPSTPDQVREDLQAVHQVAPGPHQRRPSPIAPSTISRQ